MTATVCSSCGSLLREQVAAGLCPCCLLSKALALHDQAPPEAILPGPSQHVGPFVLLEEIARGGMGTVYRAREQPLGRMVALKLLRGGEAGSSDFLARFHTEAKAASALVHPNIVPVYAFGEDGGVWFIAMRLMEGGSLAARIQLRGTIQSHAHQQRESAVILKKLAEAVHYAHERGILHRDLKPENVLLDTAGEPYLTDFGLARLTESDTRVTRSHISLGTPAYIAPEVALGGSAEATVASDVYGLGAVMYELLTGQPPFSGPTPLEVLRRVSDTEPRLPSTFVRTVDRDLETICLKAMAREPRQRYETGAALARDLERWLGGQPIEARPSGQLERTLKWVKRRPLIAALLGMLTLLALVIILGSWKINADLRARSEQQRQALVQNSIETANRILTQGDPATALLSLNAAIRLASGHPAQEEMQRRRLGLAQPDLPRLERVFTHDGAVNTVAFRPDGLALLTASADGTARIWDLSKPSAPVILKHPGPVQQALFSPDGMRVLTLCQDGFARCWLASNGALSSPAWPIRLSLYQMPLNPTASFSPNGQRVITVSAAGVQLWDVATGQPALPTLDAATNYTQAAFSPDGNSVVATRENGEVRVWTLKSGGAELRATYQHAASALYASFSPDGQRILSAAADARAVVWSAANGAEVFPPLQQQTPARLNQAVYSAAGDRILTLSFDHSLRVWDAQTGAPLAPAILQPKGVIVARWDPAGQRIISGGDDGLVRIWDARTGRLAGPLLPHGRYVVDAAFSLSGQTLATACLDGRARIWSLGPGSPSATLEPAGALRVGFLSPDGTRVAAEQGDGLLRITDLSRPGAAPIVLRHEVPLAVGAFSPAGDRLATMTLASEIHLWDLRQGTELAPPRSPGRSLACLQFDSTGEHFVTIGMAPKPSDRPRLTLWNAHNLESTSLAVPNDSLLNQAEFSPDGRRLLTSSEKGIVRLWDIAAQKETGPAIQLGTDAGHAHFSPEGRFLATVVVGQGFEAGQATLWSADTHQPLGRPMAHEDGVAVCQFAPAGDRLATGSEDSTARIWSVPTGEPLTPPMPHDATVKQLLFTPDGTILATASSLGQVRLWDAATGNALMPSRPVPGGIAAMAFAPATSEFVVVSLDGVVRRWNYAPAREPLPELERLAVDLNGGDRKRLEATTTPGSVGRSTDNP